MAGIWIMLLLISATATSGRRLAAERFNGVPTIQDEEGSCSPYEVHVALGEDEQSMKIAWRTQGDSCSSVVYFGAMRYRQLKGSMPDTDIPALRSTVGNKYCITQDIMCSAPARAQPFSVHMHLAYLSDLEPGEQYWYRLADSTREFVLRAPVPTGADFSFVAFGDMGVKKKKCAMASKVMQRIQEQDEQDPLDLVVHVGDLAYADGRHKTWDAFMQAIEPVASRLPWMVGIGNHEYAYSGPSDNDLSGVQAPYRPSWGNYGDESGGECGTMTARRFIMPNVRAGTDNAPFWYSHDYGSVHFTYISTEHDISPGSVQYRWLQRDLAAVDRCATPWVVLALHRPLYVVFPHKENRIVGDHLRQYIEDLLVEYKVDLTLAGHVHTYYRTCDVRQERCVQDGTGISHFVIGTGGHVLSDITDEQKAWLEGDVHQHGFVRFDVRGDKMFARFIVAATGEVGDEVTLRAQVSADDACGEGYRAAEAASA